MRPPRLVDVLLSELDEDVLEQIAERLLPHLRVVPPTASIGWMDSAGAAEYLGISRNALRKHTAARTIPFEQAGPNGKLWFQAAELDDWRRAVDCVDSEVKASKCFQAVRLQGRPGRSAAKAR